MLRYGLMIVTFSAAVPNGKLALSVRQTRKQCLLIKAAAAGIKVADVQRAASQRESVACEMWSTLYHVVAVLFLASWEVFGDLQVSSDIYSARVMAERSIVRSMSVCVSVCLSASVSEELHVQTSTNLCMSWCL